MLFAFEWIIIGMMLGLNAVLSAYEMALASVSHARLVVLNNQKKPGAESALFMKERMEGSFAVIQLGLTLCAAIAAATGGAFVDEHLTPVLIRDFHWSFITAEIVALLCFVLPLSAATIIFAELVPKLFAIRNKEWVCLLLSPAMRRISVIVAPVVTTLERVVKSILHMGQKRMKTWNPEFETAGLHELQAAVALARTSRVIGAREEKIVLSAAQLATRPVREIILPAADISLIPATATLTEALLTAHLDLHTRFPVAARENDPQSIEGYLTFKDLVVSLKMNPGMPTIQGIMRPIKRLPESMAITQVLEQMMREKVHIALVTDAAATQILGMVTLEDIVEELLGDIEDEFDHLPTHFHPAGQGWIVGGGVSVATVFQCLGLKVAPEAVPAGRLAEWCTTVLQRPVAKGDIIRAEGLEIIIRKLRRRKVSEAFISLIRP